ncbi:MAG: hypothetical protein VZR32_06675, partial [Candidatus Weimeria sp.]|nr:hypothetical protein [Candidatus Weimeria sp.]
MVFAGRPFSCALGMVFLLIRMLLFCCLVDVAVLVIRGQLICSYENVAGKEKNPPERAKKGVCGGKQVEEEASGSGREGEKPPERAKKGISGGIQVEEEALGSSRYILY